MNLFRRTRVLVWACLLMAHAGSMGVVAQESLQRRNQYPCDVKTDAQAWLRDAHLIERLPVAVVETLKGCAPKSLGEGRCKTSSRSVRSSSRRNAPFPQRWKHSSRHRNRDLQRKISRKFFYLPETSVRSVDDLMDPVTDDDPVTEQYDLFRDNGRTHKTKPVTTDDTMPLKRYYVDSAYLQQPRVLFALGIGPYTTDNFYPPTRRSKPELTEELAQQRIRARIEGLMKIMNTVQGILSQHGMDIATQRHFWNVCGDPECPEYKEARQDIVKELDKLDRNVPGVVKTLTVINADLIAAKDAFYGALLTAIVMKGEIPKDEEFNQIARRLRQQNMGTWFNKVPNYLSQVYEAYCKTEIDFLNEKNIIFNLLDTGKIGRFQLYLDLSNQLVAEVEREKDILLGMIESETKEHCKPIVEALITGTKFSCRRKEQLQESMRTLCDTMTFL